MKKCTDYVITLQYEGQKGSFFLDASGNWTPNSHSARRFSSRQAADKVKKSARRPRFAATVEIITVRGER